MKPASASADGSRLKLAEMIEYKPADLLSIVQPTEDEPAHLLVMQDGHLMRVSLSVLQLLTVASDAITAARHDYQRRK